MKKIVIILFAGIIIGASLCLFYLKIFPNNRSNYLRVGEIQQNYEMLLRKEVKDEIESRFNKNKEKVFTYDWDYETEVAKLKENPNNTIKEKLNEVLFTVFSDKYLHLVKCTAVNNENVKTGSSDIFSIEPPYTIKKIYGVNLEDIDKILCFELQQNAND